MELINKDALLLMIDKVESKLESKGKLLRCRNVKYLVNLMPSVIVDEKWEVDLEVLNTLLKEE